MNNMNFIVWMLPIIFMIHDFEEIIMVEIWGKRYLKKINEVWPKRQPFALKYVNKCQTPTFSIGVEVEFLFFSLISWFSVAFHHYFIWYAAMLGFILHLVIFHILMCIQFKNYVPGIVTSIVFFFPSIFYAYTAAKLLVYNISTILLAFLVGIILLLVMLPVLHKLMGQWSDWLYKYSMKSN